MAAQQILVRLIWENEVSFEMTRKKDEDDAVTIVKAEEQGAIGALWPHIENICKEQFSRDLKTIGDDMKV